MMTRSSALEQKKKKIEQKLIRLKEQEVKVKILERKAHTKSLIDLGSLVAKAGLDHLPRVVLYGAFLNLKEQLEESSTFKHWEELGMKALAHEIEIEQKKVITIHFKQQISLQMKEALRALKLKWNKLRQEWEGEVTQQHLSTLTAQVEEEGGTITFLMEGTKP